MPDLNDEMLAMQADIKLAKCNLAYRASDGGNDADTHYLRFLGAVCRLAQRTTDIGFSDFVRHAKDTGVPVERNGNVMRFTDKVAGGKCNVTDCGRLSRLNYLGLVKCDPEHGNRFTVTTLGLKHPVFASAYRGAITPLGLDSLATVRDDIEAAEASDLLQLADETERKANSASIDIKAIAEQLNIRARTHA